MSIRVCVAGATGWTGSEVVKGLVNTSDLQLTGAIARKSAGQDIGNVLGLPSLGVRVSRTLEEALAQPMDVLVDYTSADSVKPRVLQALSHGLHVVVGSSGLNVEDFREIDKIAQKRGVGVIAAGNFSLTAAMAKHLAMIAAQYLPSREIIDYAQADKPDAPSGTARELAAALENVRPNTVDFPVAETIGQAEARGATVDGTQIHSVRLPNYAFAFETLFGLPGESLIIRHDAGSSAVPYVTGTLLAVRKVMQLKGLVRGFDTLLFS